MKPTLRSWTAQIGMLIAGLGVVGCHHANDLPPHDHSRDILVDDGHHMHEGYYDEGGKWHGGYYDEKKAYHSDPADWKDNVRPTD